MPHTDLDGLRASFPHGVARRAELLAHGVTPSTLTRRCRPGGPWQRLLPGVVLLSHAPPEQVQRMCAALRYGGPGSMITGRFALAAHGLLEVSPHQKVHVLLPARRRLRGTDAVHLESCARPPTSVRIGGLAVAPAGHAALDASRLLGECGSASRDGAPFTQVMMLLASVIDHGSCDARSLLDSLGPRARGSWLPRAVLREFLRHPELVDQARTDAARAHLPSVPARPIGSRVSRNHLFRAA